MLNTLPERIALARREGLDYADFLQIVLADEVSRRDRGRLELRLRQAGFEQLCRLEDFDWSAQVRRDRRLLDAACSLQFLDRREHVLLVGPVGVGKSFLAQALSVRFVAADQYFREMAQARVDHSTEKDLPRLPRPRAADPRRPRDTPALNEGRDSSPATPARSASALASSGVVRGSADVAASLRTHTGRYPQRCLSSPGALPPRARRSRIALPRKGIQLVLVVADVPRAAAAANLATQWPQRRRRNHRLPPAGDVDSATTA